MANTPIPVVAIVNTSEEVSALLTALFQMEGFRTVATYAIEFKRGKFDFEAFVEEHHPDVVVWISPFPTRRTGRTSAR